MPSTMSFRIVSTPRAMSLCLTCHTITDKYVAHSGWADPWRSQHMAFCYACIRSMNATAARQETMGITWFPSDPTPQGEPK